MDLSTGISLMRILWAASSRTQQARHSYHMSGKAAMRWISQRVSKMYQTFSDYQLVTQLARKTASCVYLAQSMKVPSDEVVLKVFDSIRLDGVQEQENFLQEVHFLKQLHHPYILPLLSGGIEEGHPFLVSKYVPLGSLRSSINSSFPMCTSLNEAMQTIVRVGQALSYAHTWKRLHTNIKPENVLFESGGQAVLTDFALHSMMTHNIPLQQPD